VAAEPWHLSHQTLASEALAALNTEVLSQLIGQHDIAGKAYLQEQLGDIKARFIDAICSADITAGDIWFG
jgi:hypothetical protein